MPSTYARTKRHDGRVYSGMHVGGTHEWDYPEGRWRERKVSPDKWEFTFAAAKRRRWGAPDGSGAEPGSTWHWLVVASQMARKVDANAYTTFMQGVKYKVGHKRPGWKAFSYAYEGRADEPTRIEALLDDARRGVREDGSPLVLHGT